MVMTEKPEQEINKDFDTARQAVLNQKGSVLISLIITMVIMASLGVGMVYMTTSSTFQELLANNHARAYYAAEAGANFVNSRIREALATGKLSVFNSMSDDTQNKTFTLSNGIQFEIDELVQDTSSGSMLVSYNSIGTVGTGFLQSKVQLSYLINAANQGNNPVGEGESPDGEGGGGEPAPALPRPASDFDIAKNELDIYYSPVDMSEVDIKDNPFVDGDRALNLKADFYVMGLKWYANPDMLQFDDIRSNNDDLLSYRAQVKIKDNNKDHSNMYNIIGISFRLDDTSSSSMTANTAYPDMYGLSYVKLPETKPTGNDLTKAPDWYQDVIAPNENWDFLSAGPAAGKWHVVLWKRNSGSTGTHTPLAYQIITSADWVCAIGTADNCTEIKDWSTLYVDVEERSGTGSLDDKGFTYSSEVKYNVITAYIQAHSFNAGGPTDPPGPYLRSTLDTPQDIWWEDDPDEEPKFRPVDWDWTGSSATAIGDIIADDSLNTLNYDSYTEATTTKAREVGLHIYNIRTNAQNVFYDNFYIDLSPSIPSGGGGDFSDGTGDTVMFP